MNKFLSLKMFISPNKNSYQYSIVFCEQECRDIRRKVYGNHLFTIFITASTTGEQPPSTRSCTHQCDYSFDAHPLAGSIGSDRRRNGSTQNCRLAAGF